MWCVLSVYDLKAQEYGPLYLARTEQVGGRMFADAVVGGPADSTLRRYPEDFVLRKVGSFDEESGELFSSIDDGGEPRDILKAVDVILMREAVPSAPEL